MCPLVGSIMPTYSQKCQKMSKKLVCAMLTDWFMMLVDILVGWYWWALFYPLKTFLTHLLALFLVGKNFSKMTKKIDKMITLLKFLLPTLGPYMGDETCPCMTKRFWARIMSSKAVLKRFLTANIIQFPHSSRHDNHF